MNEQQLKRYQAGRCDAHGNRVIAFDQNYLRGFFAAFEDLDENPFVAQHECDCPICRIEYQAEALKIDLLVNDYLASMLAERTDAAFNRGKKAL